jgi:hypothetical protein
MTNILWEYKEENVVKDYLYSLLKISVSKGSFSKELIPNKLNAGEFLKIKEREQVVVEQIYFNDPERKKHYLVGNLMKKVRGKIPAAEVAEIVGFKNGGVEYDG